MRDRIAIGWVSRELSVPYSASVSVTIRKLLNTLSNRKRSDTSTYKLDANVEQLDECLSWCGFRDLLS